MLKFLEKKMGGAGSARNVGLDNASGKYIYFMDPDDEILPELLIDNISLMEEYKADLIIFDSFSRFSDDEIIHDESYLSKEKLLNHADFVNNFEYLFKRVNVYCPWNKLYRRKLILDYKLRFNNQMVGEDAIFNFNYFDVMSNIFITSKKYYIYTERYTGLSKNYSKRRYEDAIQMHIYMDYFLNNRWNLHSTLPYRNLITFFYNNRKRLTRTESNEVYEWLSANRWSSINFKAKIKMIILKLRGLGFYL